MFRQSADSPRGTLVLCREERALGQTVFVQCVNEVVARCSLFTGILFVHPGLKHSYEIRTATLAWQMLFEQLGSVRVDGHAAVFGCLSQAVSEFPVQIERHVHLSTSLPARTTTRSTTRRNRIPRNRIPWASKDRYHCTVSNAYSRPDASKYELVGLTAGGARRGRTARVPGSVAPLAAASVTGLRGADGASATHAASNWLRCEGDVR